MAPRQAEATLLVVSSCIIFRDTMLQALRFCLCGAGSKMAEPLKKQATTTLLGMLSSQEETTRSVVFQNLRSELVYTFK
jgi:hypothetical protein